MNPRAIDALIVASAELTSARDRLREAIDRLESGPQPADDIPDDYIYLEFGPWEASGHQCWDIVHKGCEEAIPARLITVVYATKCSRVVGSELGDCPNQCGPKAIARDGV